MITKTDKFRVKINTPRYAKETTVRQHCSSPLYENFPDVFEPIYKLEDGTELCLGDPIWRSKNYEVKSTSFYKVHIEQDTPIFGTRENCEKWLETNAENIKTELLKQNKSSSFISLKSLANKLNDLETLSYKELSQIRDGIHICIKNIEKL